MKKIVVLLLLSVSIFACSKAEEKTKPVMIKGADLDTEGGADAYANAGDNSESMYYKNPDFYNLKSSDTLMLIEKYKTFIQTTEYNCGPASVLTIYNFFGIKDVTEEQLAIGMKTSVDSKVDGSPIGSANQFYDYGTDVKRMVEYFESDHRVKVVETSYVEDYKDSDLLSDQDGVSGNDIGNLSGKFIYTSLYASENTADTDKWVDDAKDSYFVKWLTGHLEKNRPIMVEWGDWDGHWVAIIGYDNNGTPGIGDDVLIFADPYDTADHWQDGYSIASLEKFFYMWKDRNVAPKPFQLQPYVVIEPANK